LLFAVCCLLLAVVGCWLGWRFHETEDAILGRAEPFVYACIDWSLENLYVPPENLLFGRGLTARAAS
jgi:hypothetical protein